MFKKLIFWSLVVGGGLLLVNGVWRGSVHTAIKRAQARFERNVSPEFELARIRDQIAELTPDMHKNITRIAEEIVQVQSLERRVGDLQARLDTAKNELAHLTTSLEQGVIPVSSTGRKYTPADIKDRLRTCKNLERELANVKKVYEAKKEGVEAAKQQLATMKEQKQELEVMAAQYEAQLKTLALEQTRAKIKLDDSRLAEIKQSFERLREKIDVQRQTAELAQQFNDGSLNEKKSETTKDAVEEAREYLGGERAKGNEAKK